jgi:hypothetical protein
MVVVVVVERDADLPEVVGAVHAAGGLAHLLDSRQQQAHQQADNAYVDQQFDESKARPWSRLDSPHGSCSFPFDGGLSTPVRVATRSGRMRRMLWLPSSST